MSEKPVERLNYYNGQRLEARDFKLEQEYHMRVRRWLNKSLYSSGIARGLEVRKEADTLNVIVSPGLALDAEGREILLWEERRVPVQSFSGSSDAVVEGNYLVIEYREEMLSTSNGGCTARTNGGPGNKLAWDGPARIRATPLLSWSSVLPHETSGKVVLAQVELESGCEAIHQVNTGVRRYVGAVAESKVRQFALDGARDIDPKNPGRIYFHIRGRQPNSVTLYLRAEKFSTLYYTEMGQHKHDLSIAFQDHAFPAHSHLLDGISTYFDLTSDDTRALSGPHGHSMFANMSDFLPTLGINPPRFDSFAFGYRPGNPIGNQAQQEIWARHSATDIMSHLNVDLSFRGGEHIHTFAPNTPTGSFPQQTLSHVPTGASSSDSHGAGVADPSPPAYSARNGAPLTYVDNLQVQIGKNVHQLENKTEAILRQLRAAQTSLTWDQIGRGSANPNHPLIENGTGPIKLDFLPGVAFTEGEYLIELSVASGGGRVLYNLYVE